MDWRQVFEGTAAGQKGQIVFLDPKGWYLMGGAGPSALLGSIVQLRQGYARPACAEPREVPVRPDLV